MKFRLPVLLFSLALAALPVFAQSATTATSPTVTTLKKSTVTVGSAIIPLAPNTKLEVLGRDGDSLIVKFRSTKGKVPLADTDISPQTVLPETAPALPEKATAPAAKPVPPQPATPLPAVAKLTAGQTPGDQQDASVSTPPALNTSGTGAQPATNYGKAVQKAKQVTETQKSTRVDPTKDIMDEEPAKKK